MDEISRITESLGSAQASSPPAAGRAQAGAFASRLIEAFQSADAEQRTAEARVQEMATGEGDVVETMVALSKAELALSFAVNVRNRALEAYNEIMRMPL